jgi:DhnA family fructose-bisphosphate aldolase class Ia
MTNLGKAIRLKRLIQEETNTCIIFAIDHGMTSPTFLRELERTKEITGEVIAGGAHVIMLSQGFAPKVVEVFQRDTSLALMLTASAPRSPRQPIQTPVASVEEALRLGADAVVVFVALQGQSDPEMITYTSKIGMDCDKLGMPLIAEAEFPTTYQTVEDLAKSYGVDYLLYNARLCAELGADIIKVNWSGSQETFADLVRAVAPVPVVLAGGSRLSDEELLQRMQLTVEVGTIGCSVGRNIFQHKNPRAITQALCRVIKEKWSAHEAMQELIEVVNNHVAV